eukprot:3703402-Rhodomonas_salina.2
MPGRGEERRKGGEGHGSNIQSAHMEASRGKFQQCHVACVRREVPAMPSSVCVLVGGGQAPAMPVVCGHAIASACARASTSHATSVQPAIPAVQCHST